MKKFILIFAAVILFAAFAWAGYLYMSGDSVLYKKVQETPVSRLEPTAESDMQPVQEEKSAADMVFETMSLDEKIYQMFFVTPETITGVKTATRAGEATRDAILKYPVGGIIYFSANLKDRQQTAQMIENSQSYSKIPLFIGVDEEGGRVSRLGQNPEMETTKHPPMSEIGETGDPKEAYEVGRILGEELSELGFNVDFAPDADVLVDKKNTEIGDRSFGSDPELVADMVFEAVKGIQEKNVSAAIKHFPGHGSTTANSHNGYSESTRSIEDLRSCEFLPFKAGIEAGVDFVLVSHMTLVNATKEKLPSTLSEEVISGFLKEELGFSGIVITDSFSMGAVTENYSVGESVVKAIDAGADMILMVPDIESASEAVMEAIESGELSEQRIDESVKKILEIKEKRNLIRQV